ncbi:MAG: preprotein translocase subunit SecG [Pirellulaceae bacterium]
MAQALSAPPAEDPLVFFFSVMVLHQYFFGITTFLISLFLILLILVQRGRGGGLSGALGGPGGQSAFGTKAGDIFTRITIVTAAIWIFWCALAVWWMQIPDVVDLNSGGGAAIPVGGAVGDGIGGANGAAGGLIPPGDLPGLQGATTPGAAAPGGAPSDASSPLPATGGVDPVPPAESVPATSNSDAGNAPASSAPPAASGEPSAAAPSDQPKSDTP